MVQLPKNRFLDFGWLKQFMPRGLYGRAALILIVPIVTLQLVVSVVFIQRHFNRITVQMTSALVLELDYLLTEVNRATTPKAARQSVERVIDPLAMWIELPGAPVDTTIRLTDFTGPWVAKTLHAGVPDLTGVDLASEHAGVIVGVITDHGPMRVGFSRDRVSASNPHQLLVLMVATGILMTLIAYLFLRNQLRPIRQLAKVAEAFGKGQVVPYKLAGATEVRSAGKAFLDMRSRIERQIEQRTLMLSGVSHDLRTPLTRLRLGLAMIDDESREDLERDVEDMERLVDRFLSFARSDALEDDPEPVDLAALTRHLADNAARAGQNVVLGELADPGTYPVRRAALERALENLLGNATRYGSQVRLSLVTGRGDLRFVIEDDGPGIPPQAREEALKPFARLDKARNQDKGSGVGLGLAIASDIARGHGGHLRLGDSADLGGLKVEFVLPR
ncbi:two-component system, OmpR family, osmolarity sensor histidine kinase EnvZ [Aliiroseovarius sediminilitoris]|uniref:histidine kinase n=1 Tax=Aliiroseovarius sediminilitoris TaxID=1173584 RepID=A0A1I0PXC3_9RHOB|nr:ATP-binding protein [Aliiroseovarius sediminilitoris]SEW19113.1 two-component system, OmpR family, osmolarity sensor histidine kinase EnvZ [Aliiroseovarius sediminilitoris]